MTITLTIWRVSTTFVLWQTKLNKAIRSMYFRIDATCQTKKAKLCAHDCKTLQMIKKLG